jgi:hypothetical protein
MENLPNLLINHLFLFENKIYLMIYIFVFLFNLLLRQLDNHHLTIEYFKLIFYGNIVFKHFFFVFKMILFCIFNSNFCIKDKKSRIDIVFIHY